MELDSLEDRLCLHFFKGAQQVFRSWNFKKVVEPVLKIDTIHSETACLAG